eukprot:11988283-Alexandrium_andersonii.AAC.1
MSASLVGSEMCIRDSILFSPAQSPTADAVPATEPDSSGADAGWEVIPSPGGPASLELVRRYRTHTEELRA